MLSSRRCCDSTSPWMPVVTPRSAPTRSLSAAMPLSFSASRASRSTWEWSCSQGGRLVLGGVDGREGDGNGGGGSGGGNLRPGAGGPCCSKQGLSLHPSPRSRPVPGSPSAGHC